MPPSYSSYRSKMLFTNSSTELAFALHTLDLSDAKKPKSLTFKSGDCEGCVLSSTNQPYSALGEPHFCLAEWPSLSRPPWHNGGPMIPRRPAYDAGGCLRSPSWLCHEGGRYTGFYSRILKTNLLKSPIKSQNIGQNRSILTHTFSKMSSRTFFFLS